MSHEHLNPQQPEHLYTTAARVVDFLSASQNNDPLLYPGERPDTSFVTDGEHVRTIGVEATEGGLSFTITTEYGEQPLNDYLDDAGVAPIEDRIPVLAFGANMSPGSLAKKFAKVGRRDALVIPTIYAELPGHDIVWSGGPGVNGNFIAILYGGEETHDTSVQVGVNFLTREQLLVMHATELSYDLASIDVIAASQQLRAYYYAGYDSVYLQDGHPVAIESIPSHNRSLPTANTTQLLEQVLSDEAIMQEVLSTHPDLSGVTPREYIQYAEQLRGVPGARLLLKQLMHQAVLAQGKSRIVESLKARNRLMSWSNPSTIPTYGEWMQGVYHHDVYRLPSQEIPQWPDAVRRKQVIASLTVTHAKRAQNRPTSKE